MHGYFFNSMNSFFWWIIFSQRTVKAQVWAAGSRGIVQIAHNCMPNIRRKNFLFKKRLHHAFKIAFPLCTVRLCFVFMLIPRMQMRKFMYGSHQKRVGVKIVIYRYTMTLSIMWGSVIAKLAVSVSRYFKLALKVIYPAPNKRCSIGRQVAF